MSSLSESPSVGAPSPFFTTHLEALSATARNLRAPILDLACGRGRHAIIAAEEGLPVVAIDVDRARLGALRDESGARRIPLRPVRADLENRDPAIALKSRSCAGILVFRFLHRPLCREIERVLAPGGLLLYETFTREQAALGWGPRSPRFLLDDGELPTLFPDLEVVNSEEGLRGAPREEHRASLLARKPLS